MTPLMSSQPLDAIADRPVPDRLTPLLAPVSDAHPGGDDLEYTAEFLALMQAAQPQAEQQYGDTIIPAQAPDWRVVIAQAEQLLARSKDVRVAVLLTQAWTVQRGLTGYAEGAQLVAALLARYRANVYPRFDEDGEHDPLPRYNALAGLFDAQGCLRALRDTVLPAASGLMLREIELVFDGGQPERLDYPGGRERLRAELARSWDSADPALRAIPATLQALDDITACCRTDLGDDWQPDVSALEKTLQRVLEAASPAAVNALEADPAVDTPADAAATPIAVNPAGQPDWRTLELRSRDDVNLLLDKVCLYLERYEPSHPAPILLRRAQRLMQLGFYDIVRDLAPDSLAQIDLLIGRTS